MACFVSVTFCEDYYDILGVGKDADSREIRKAFKKLALTEHPDKNKAEGAQENFLKISKAYETLKDEEKRKRYDRFGEEDDEQQQQQRQRGYQSWNYYHDDFGLYDDDPEIITLDYNDFRRSVKDAYSFWFINYYSPQCSHCHDLAPTWRRLAHKLEGIVRIGAVNCQDDFMLCRQQNIRGYPSLIFYNPNGASSKFNGAKEEEYLMEFIVKNLPEYWFSMRKENYEHVTQKTDRGQMPDSPWIIFFCSSNSFQCPEQTERKLLAHTLNGIVNVGLVDCDNDESFCNKKTGDDLGVYFFHTAKDTLKPNLAHKLAAAENIKETRKEVLDLLPDVPLLDDEKYSKVRIKLEDDIGPGWLIHFVFGKDGDHRDEKTIQPKIGKIKFGKVDCFKCPEACKEMFIKKPQYVMFKVGGGFEFHYGREEPSDVIEFARVSNQAVTMTTLSDSDFPDIISSNGVFIDFFAPWCPPCLNLLPEFRKASINVGGSIIFGTVDCTVYGSICNQYNIRSYPTTVFFNMSKPHFYHGHHTADGLSEFVMEILRPSVMNLNYAEFQNLVGRKPENEMWLVDFFAPCKKMSRVPKSAVFFPTSFLPIIF